MPSESIKKLSTLALGQSDRQSLCFAAQGTFLLYASILRLEHRILFHQLVSSFIHF